MYCFWNTDNPIIPHMVGKNHIVFLVIKNDHVPLVTIAKRKRMTVLLNIECRIKRACSPSIISNGTDMTQDQSIWAISECVQPQRCQKQKSK